MDTTADRLIARYMERLDELSLKVGPVVRFYQYMIDDELYDLEQKIEMIDGSSGVAAAMLGEKYRGWVRDMSLFDRMVLVEYNNSTNSANRNGFLEEVIDNNGNVIEAPYMVYKTLV